ncbi:MAG: protein-L-isoaspartate(D-aspartate) O-methyltransferase [Verrucomicrobiales bacterium]|nr:protein-L-isoaspartate(D-aspartate) O-methyltransferase [Verrucomicrobiales bacterium]
MNETPVNPDDFPFQNEHEALIEELTRGNSAIKDENVIQALKSVPRHKFVLQPDQPAAYENHPLPIGFDQTISQPFIVGYMTEHLRLKPEDRVLEIGTGSGYQAAVLALLVSEVYTIEIIPQLAETAALTLRQNGFENIFIKTGDGHPGWPEKAPFDAIIVTCAPTKIPDHLVNQLKEGGRMIIPVGKQDNAQQLCLLSKKDGILHQKAILPVRFVPMTGLDKNGTG